ncbi:hypothetical protein JMUB6875_20650 [Nocardia sp. JMUB6875]|uniref:hypothetical protein n=1 Tax=Nocardia sp. JMUB6875 TaxID=3158170 RepID=UPI0032E777E5
MKGVGKLAMGAMLVGVTGCAAAHAPDPVSPGAATSSTVPVTTTAAPPSAVPLLEPNTPGTLESWGLTLSDFTFLDSVSDRPRLAVTVRLRNNAAAPADSSSVDFYSAVAYTEGFGFAYPIDCPSDQGDSLPRKGVVEASGTVTGRLCLEGTWQRMHGPRTAEFIVYLRNIGAEGPHANWLFPIAAA